MVTTAAGVVTATRPESPRLSGVRLAPAARVTVKLSGFSGVKSSVTSTRKVLSATSPAAHIRAGWTVRFRAMSAVTSSTAPFVRTRKVLAAAL